MGTIGYCYGSEWHVLRMLGHHRHQFSTQLAKLIGGSGTSLRWLDMPYNGKAKSLDGEIKSVDFLHDRGGRAWKEYWPDKRTDDPNRDGVPSWDTVGLLESVGAPAWVLLEAKSHIAELTSSTRCQAGGDSLRKIKSAFEETWDLMGGDPAAWQHVGAEWCAQGAYQIANRLACLNFLRNRYHQRAHLVFVYFLNDCFRGRQCPSTPAVWQKSIKPIYARMGLAENHKLAGFVHTVFVDVRSGQFRTAKPVGEAERVATEGDIALAEVI